MQKGFAHRDRKYMQLCEVHLQQQQKFKKMIKKILQSNTYAKEIYQESSAFFYHKSTLITKTIKDWLSDPL
jgi:hypothetical protein